VIITFSPVLRLCVPIVKILFVGPEKAIKFTTNNYVLNYTDNKILAGMCGGLSQIIITNPMEILKNS
jgi:hypothetical protein